jgi:transposase-like protein
MSGLKRRIKEKTLCFSDDEKRVIIEDYLQSGATKQSI